MTHREPPSRRQFHNMRPKTAGAIKVNPHDMAMFEAPHVPETELQALMEAEPHAPVADSAEEIMARGDDQVDASLALGDALEGLGDRERHLVVGRVFRGRSFGQLANELGISKTSAFRLHGEAMFQLKQDPQLRQLVGID